MTQSSEGLRQLLRDIFALQKLCVLATQGSGQPYGSLVAFAETGDLKHILFATRRDTRKYSNVAADRRVALLIDSRSNEPANFRNAVAVTALGSAAEVKGNRRNRLVKVFLDKHPYLEAFVNSPETALCRVAVEEYVVARLKGVDKVDSLQLDIEVDREIL